MTDPHRIPYELDALEHLTNYYQWIVDESAPFLGMTIAELGGGIGTFTAFLVRTRLEPCPDSSLEVFETDSALYRSMVDRLQDRFPALVRAGRLRLTYGAFGARPQQFDTVIMVNVLEHVPDDDKLIRAVYRSLPPNGALIVFVPALQWLFSPLDRAVGHCRRYDKGGLRRLLESTGFSIAKATYMDMMGVLPWYVLNVLGRSRTINSRLARAYDHWLVPVTRAIERRVGAFIGKNLLVVGRKGAS